MLVVGLFYSYGRSLLHGRSLFVKETYLFFCNRDLSHVSLKQVSLTLLVGLFYPCEMSLFTKRDLTLLVKET